MSVGDVLRRNVGDFKLLTTTIFGMKNQDYFGRYIKTTYKDCKYNGGVYANIDFISKTEKVVIEFKSRNITHNKYETAILNSCKIINYIEKYKKKKYKFYVYYLYSDGLFRVRLDAKTINGLKQRKLFSYQEANKSGFKYVVDVPHEKMVFVSSLSDYMKKSKI